MLNDVLDSFINENELSFNDFFDIHRVNCICKKAEYIELKRKKNEIYNKYPEILHFIEDNKPMNFNEDTIKAFNELISIYSFTNKIELKEAYKLGAKDCYVFMEDMNIIKK